MCARARTHEYDTEISCNLISCLVACIVRTIALRDELGQTEAGRTARASNR